MAGEVSPNVVPAKRSASRDPLPLSFVGAEAVSQLPEEEPRRMGPCVRRDDTVQYCGSRPGFRYGLT